MITATGPIWKPNENLPLGRGATVQQFFATVGADRLEIDVAPWGEGTLQVNGMQVAQVSDKKNRQEAFRALKIAAQHYLGLRPAPIRQRRPS